MHRLLSVTLIVYGSLIAAVFGGEALTPEALQGAWKLHSVTLDGKRIEASGYMFFYGQYYSFITADEVRPAMTREMRQKSAEELTTEETQVFVDSFNSMTAAAGKYIIEGDHLAYVMEVVRTPYLTGNTSTKRKCTLEGNRLTQEFQGGDHYRVMVWEKVSP